MTVTGLPRINLSVLDMSKKGSGHGSKTNGRSTKGRKHHYQEEEG